MASASPSAIAELDRLLGYLDQDPGNAALLSDAADAAIGVRRPEKWPV